MKKGEHSTKTVELLQKQRTGGSFMRDYSGKTAYFGIDVHKKTYAVAAIVDGQVHKPCTVNIWFKGKPCIDSARFV